MIYKLDVKAFINEYCTRQNKMPPVEVVKMWEMIVDFCNQTYQQGLNGTVFIMPAGIPVIRYTSNAYLQ